MAVKVPVALGGTGADNAADARANLGVSGNTSGGVYSGIAISNAQITSSNVSGNVTVLTGNVMLTKAGANVTFESPGSTVVGAQFKTPAMHDLATQRVITLKSNNYSGNRSADYLVPTMNIKAKYNNVSINTTGRIIYANRFDDESLMPDTAKYEGFVAYERNPGGVGELYFSNTQSRQKLYNANATLTPSQNNAFDLGSAAFVFKELHIGANSRFEGNVIVDKGLVVGTDDFVIKYENPVDFRKIGIGTKDPQHEVDIRANVYISGNLTVKGNVYAVDTTHLIIDDPVIELGANTVGTPTLDTGVLMNRGNLANAFMGFDESQDEFVMGLTSDPSSVTTINLSSYAPLQVGPLYTNYSANIAGNASISRSLAVGYTDQRVPQANLDVKGNVYIDGNTHVRDQQILSFGTGKDLQIYHNGAHSYISDQGTGSLILLADDFSIQNAAGSEQMATSAEDGAVTLYYDGTAKLATTGTGLNITGIGANVTGNVSVTRSLAVGWTDGRVPQANLEVAGNANVGILTATSLRVNGTAIATTFLGLSDTPSSYSSQAGKLAAVNSSTNALEFVDDNAVVMAIALG